MNLIKTTLDGLVVLKPIIIKDRRGYFMESYHKKNTNNLIGNVKFVQENESESSRGVFRGLHFQKPPFAQAKLVRCLKGGILDVALDLRKDSKTYGQFETTLLTDENKNQLFIPKGFAHGFIVLSESAIMSYKVDEYYKPMYESGIIWDDRDLNIDWKINKKEIIVSKKDAKLQSFNNFVSPFL